MRCGSCGTENESSRKFCGECGGALARHCGACGAENAPTVKFCGECGAGLGEAPRRSDSVGPGPVVRDPRSYTPKHLADKILQSKSALEGERKQVTVLFADVKGSLELAEQAGAEQWHAILERFFTVLSDAVHRFEGTINQYTGDGIMALFGAPIAHEDHAQRACYAALHMKRELRTLQDELRIAQGIDLQVRIGIHSGEVVVGKIGDDLRMDYTAQGHVVGLAQRMESIAAPNTAVLSGDTAKRVEGYFALRSLGSSAVKGVREPVAVFELEGVGAARTRLDVSRARGFTRFVGRGGEIAELEAALARAEAGQGQMLGIVAEAGAGKSRLCQEFADRCRSRGVQVRSATGVAHGKAVPLFPILTFYRQALGLDERDEPALARQKVAGALAQLDPGLLDALPLLCEFLGIPSADGKITGVAGPERERRVLSILKRVTQARSARQTAVLIFEDLHWFDPASDAILAGIAETVDGARTLLVVNFRPEYHAEWMGRSYYRQLTLAPLGAEALAELLASLLGTDASLMGLPELIRAHTGGNPYFVEEVVRSLVESGALEGAPGHFRCVRRPETLEIPASVQGVLAARIDRLAEREKRVLQAASVIGREFAEPQLRRVAELAEGELADALRALVQAELLFETALYPELAYAFKHPLTRDVAYDSQLQARRAQTHRALAHAMIELHGERGDEGAALVAEHLERGGEAREAARWHARAGAWASPRNADAAVVHWQRVRALLPDPSGEDELKLARAAAAQVVVNGARRGLSEQEFGALCEEVLALARRTDDARLEAQVFAARCVRSIYTRTLDPESVARMRAAAERAGDAATRVMAMAVAHSVPNSDAIPTQLRDIEEALHLSGHELWLGAELIGYATLPVLHAHRAAILARLGRFPEAEAASERAQQVARQCGDPMGETLCLLVCGFAPQIAEDGPALIALMRRFLEVSARVEHSAFPAVRTASLLRLSLGHSLAGEAELAFAAIREVQASAGQRSDGQLEEALAFAHFAAGDPAAALAHAAAMVQGMSVPVAEAFARTLRALARIRSEGASGAAAAREDLDRAEAILREYGFAGHAGRIAETRAEIAAALGDAPARLQHLREAKRLHEEMGLPKRAAAVGVQLRALGA